MISAYRTAFNQSFTPQRYQAFLQLFYQRCGMTVPFRVCETPCFFPATLLQKMADYGQEMILQLTGDKDYLAAARATIPAAYRVPNEDPLPLFVQVDYGIDEGGEPKLVEIQGFPSLYAFQAVLAQTYIDAYGLGKELNPYLPGVTAMSYRERLQKAILGDCTAENVVLLEITPEKQKTRPDFLVTEEMFGVRSLCISEVISEGRHLFYRNTSGKNVPIHRIYNRVIFDELARTEIQSGIDFTKEYAVEWAGHPNWYNLISKFSLPYLNHACVPETRLLSDFETLPTDLDDWVLKPLFSFAGLGVVVGPTSGDIEAVADASTHVLQRRVSFVPTIDTPEGATKAEVRIMYITDTETGVPMPQTALVRMGRGKQLGVDHNRDAEWVGASAALTVQG